MDVKTTLKKSFYDVVGMLGGVGSDALKELLKFGTLGYLATFEPSRYRQFGWTCEQLWQSTWSFVEAVSGKNSWLTTFFSWVDVISKGGFIVRLILIGILWTMVFFCIKHTILFLAQTFRRQ